MKDFTLREMRVWYGRPVFRVYFRLGFISNLPRVGGGCALSLCTLVVRCFLFTSFHFSAHSWIMLTLDWLNYI